MTTCCRISSCILKENEGGELYEILRRERFSCLRSCLYAAVRRIDCFFDDFGCEKIVTRTAPGFTEYINALAKNGYIPYPANERWERTDYYIKRRLQPPPDR